MTSFSCLLIAGGVMLLTGQPWVRRQTSHVNTVVWGAVAVAIFAAFIDSSGALLGLLGRTSSLTGRTDVWKAVLSIHTNPLLGAGYESFWLGDRIEEVWRIVGFNNFAEAHNGYLEIYINLGWLGLIMLGVLFVSGYRNALTSLRIDPLTGRLKMAFFGAALIFNLSEAGFTMMGPMWIAFLVAIINVPLISQSQVYQQPFKIPLAPGVPQKQIRILQ
jgi:O-antigen ligase